MRGHVIVERESKKGSVFVPNEHIRFELIVLEDEAVLSALKTYTEAESKVLWSTNRETKLREECDFVSEVTIPTEMMRLAWYSITRHYVFNTLTKEAKVAYQKTKSYGIETEGWPSLASMGKSRFDKRNYPSSLHLNTSARFALYRRLQGWILDAGGLI